MIAYVFLAYLLMGLIVSAAYSTAMLILVIKNRMDYPSIAVVALPMIMMAWPYALWLSVKHHSESHHSN